MAKKVASNDYAQMDDGASLFGTHAEDFDSWDSHRLAEFLSSAGLSAYKKMVIEHKITGKHAPLLSDDDMRDMGMIVVGDRLRFKQLMMTMGRKSKFCNSSKAIWSGEEQKYYSDTQQFLGTCFGMVPQDPTTYKLTPGNLKIKYVEPVGVGPLSAFCFTNYSLKNIDLATVKDIEVIDTKAPCPHRVFCCASGKDLIEIHTIDSDGKVVLMVKEGDGDSVGKLILDQVESAQMIERD